MGLRPHARVSAFGVAVVIAVGLCAAGHQITVSRLYSASPAYRAQVAALLDGHFALSTAPEALRHDFAWTPHGVQQVWGLGVPLWQLPFEAVARVIGASPFPDRVPLLLWIALAVMVTIRAFGRRPGGEPWWVGGGSVLIVALLPPFVTLVRGRVGVYEEAAIYAYGAAIMLLAGMLRVDARRWRFLALLAAAGLVGFIRPTVAVYGVATAVVASVQWLRARGRRGLVEVAIGAVLFGAGGGALYATNAARFGDGFEFGHRLNLQPLPGNLYATRFSYPMQRAGLGEASVELATSLFDRPELRSHGGFFEPDLHHGVSDRPRWREYYFTTFSWWWLPALLAGLVLGVRRRSPLLAWSVIALGPLVAFYLRAPFMASRYQLDFAPAFAALVVVAWQELARWRRHVAVPVALGVLWATAVVTAHTAQRRKTSRPVDRATAAAMTAELTDAPAYLRAYPSAYDLADPWIATATELATAFDRCRGSWCLHGERPKDSEQWTVTERAGGETVATHVLPPVLYLNLYGWNLETGQMPPATFAFMANPHFVELEVTTVDGHAVADWSREVRVAVGPVHLRLARVTPGARGMTTLRFEAAAPLPAGLQVAYFAFGPDDGLAKPMSTIAVHRMQWR
jgi:hypothetical protein